jgi:hypothetical protein
MAVKNGVVAPSAWLNDTGMYLNETLPPRTDNANVIAKMATFE